MNKNFFKATSILLTLFIVICCALGVYTVAAAFERNKPHVHCFGDWIIVKRATCTEEGMFERYCSCGENQTMSSPSIGHEFVFHDGRMPTCTQDGWHDYRTCTRCEFNDFLAIPAMGHEYGEWIVSEQSSCYEQGVEIRVCLHDETHIEKRCLQTVGHTEGEWKIAVQPSCESDGLKVKKCTVCDEVLETEVIPALGHDYGEWEQVTAPNCTEAGIEIRTCKHDGLHTEFRETAAFGHNYEWACDEYGHSAYCTECGDVTELSSHEWNENGDCGVCGYEKPQESQLSFERSGDTYAVTGLGSVTLTEIEIPSVYNGLSVTAIAPYAFEGSSVTAVIIPDTVTSIGKGAFRLCEHLTSVILSDNLTEIGEEAFYSCSQLKFLTIPRSVTFIGANSFYGCSFTFVEFESAEGWYLYDGNKNMGDISAEYLRNPREAVEYIFACSKYTWKKE